MQIYLLLTLHFMSVIIIYENIVVRTVCLLYGCVHKIIVPVLIAV